MNLAIFLPNWIGDVVMATPAIRALCEHFAPTRCIAVGRPYTAGVLEGAPWFDDQLTLERTGPWSHQWLSVVRHLRHTRIDLAILFPNSFRSALVAWMGGCRRRVGFNRYARGSFLTDRLQPILDERGNFKPSPIIDDYNRLAQAAGCPWPGHDMKLFTTPGDEAAADALWKKFQFHPGTEVICLNPGAAFGAAKFWPATSFARLAQDLVELRGSRVLVLCGPAERDQARTIAKLANRPQVRSLADETLSVGLTKAIIRRCALLATTDSGPRHFAAAFNRPVVSLFGPTFIAWTETYFKKAINLQKPVPCGPCQQRVCPLDHTCMKSLSPQEVLGAVQSLISTERKAS